ncbi:MAG: hypothetical protein DSZ05_09625 [Sulfurospirillum sp.]|nr:MAG: hypothetical protein DSZ05_09625 [Sulfurospirillum sp.]
MRYFILLFALLFQGCLYFNEKGISAHLYDNCHEYYDECGNYRKECPPNLADYTEIAEGVSKMGHEIKAYIDPPSQKAADATRRCP